VFTVTEVFGDPNNQALDEDGNKLWELEEVESESQVWEHIGWDEEPVLVKEKRIAEGWSVEIVAVNVEDENGDVVDTVPKTIWTYSGDDAVETDEGTQYPPRYEWVQVQQIGEDGKPAFKKVKVYGWVTKTETETVRTPVLDPIDPDPAAREVYDRIYPRTPYEVENEDGGTGMVTPPELFGHIAGHV